MVTLTVGLLWHSFSSDNLGVGALSESQIAICEAAARRAGVTLRFVVFGSSGGLWYMPVEKDIRQAKDISLKQLLTGRSAFLRDLEECDVVLDIGEGDSFTDIYGMRRFRIHTATKIAVLAKGCPLILSPQTIGPFEHWYSRWLAGQVMRRCERVFVRDGLSADYMRSCGLAGQVDEAIDVAFRLPYAPAERGHHGKPRIGINVSGLLYSGGYSGRNQFNLSVSYRQHVRDLLAIWGTGSSVEVWLIPHVVPDDLPRDDDRSAITALASEFPQVRVAPVFRSPGEAKSFISGLSFMTGARMHACIAAISSGVPVVPFAYSRKFNGLFATLGYPWLADGRTMTNAQALATVVEGFERRDVLAVATASAMKVAENRLVQYECYLAEFFSTCSAKKVI